MGPRRYSYFTSLENSSQSHNSRPFTSEHKPGPQRKLCFYAVQRLARRKQSSQEACRTAVAPLLTRYCGRSTAFLQERLAGANAAFWRWALQAWEAGPSGVASTLLLALLLALLSALAVVLSITSYSLGRQVAEKVAQVIQTTGAPFLLFLRDRLGFVAAYLQSIKSYGRCLCARVAKKFVSACSGRLQYQLLWQAAEHFCMKVAHRVCACLAAMTTVCSCYQIHSTTAEVSMHA